MKTGIELIADERQRQIEVEGWTPEHDDEHNDQSLQRAANCYADASSNILSALEWATTKGVEFARRHEKTKEILADLEEIKADPLKYHYGRDDNGQLKPPRFDWPSSWNTSWWKPSADPIRNLVKAGALIAAEIDRLQRQSQQTEPGGC